MDHAEAHISQAPSVLMAMSGGVDSSVSALLLLREGYRVTGATMELISRSVGDSAGVALSEHANARCSSDDIADAKAVCARLGLEHMTFDLKSLFEQKVIERFCSTYIEGRTPNPCIDCNRFLKFEALHQLRRELGLDYMATGHYARKRFDETSGKWMLLRGADPSKDQSYFLYSITQDQLAHTLFPLGELTKGEVREMAREGGFTNAEKPESQDICFVPDGDHINFIEARMRASQATGGAEPAAFREGPIVDRNGNRIGTHTGLIRYTVGQRKGIGLAAPEPLYVFAKDAARNELVVGTSDEMLIKGVCIDDVNLISQTSIPDSQHIQVKTHYRQTPTGATIRQSGPDELSIIFDKPQRAAAAGQAAVLYDGDIVIGGGTIRECF